jgi:NTE family protein
VKPIILIFFCISVVVANAQDTLPQDTFQQDTLTQQMPSKIGVTLSGGGARGFAHLGVLQALEDNGIVPAYIAGASMGALLGSIYANGMRPCDIYRFARKQKYYRLISPTRRYAAGGQIKKNFMVEMLDKVITHNSFDSLQKKLFVSVTNFDLAQSEIMSTGALKTALCASAAIPFVFEPITIGKYRYVDGGVLNNLPVEPLLEIPDCRYIIGISVISTGNAEHKKWSGIEPVLRFVDIANKNTEIENRRKCDFFIEIEEAGTYSIMDFRQIDTLYRMGYDAMTRYIENTPELQELRNIIEEQE